MQKELRGMKMSNKNKTEITIETHRTFIVRRRPSLTYAWCDGCAATVNFASPEDAAQLAGSSAREIYRAVEAGQLHFIEAGDRLLRVCLDSLLPAGTQAMPTRHLDAATDSPLPVEEGLTLPLTEMMSETVVETIHPDGSTSRKKAWTLTREAFDLLLASLDADRELAAHKYELIRAKLLKYFECRGCLSPEDLADDTINRVARRLYEGRQIQTAEPASYFYGVARNVLREYWVSPEREFTTLESLPSLMHSHTDVLRHQAAESEHRHVEHRLDRLAACLSQLPAESRELILDYYQGERGERISHRKQMAERLGIPQNALRIRVHRIRERLERSFSEQLRQSHAP
jgi:RNA polymerase sigma factor (sigma-70 family)